MGRAEGHENGKPHNGTSAMVGQPEAGAARHTGDPVPLRVVVKKQAKVHPLPSLWTCEADAPRPNRTLMGLLGRQPFRPVAFYARTPGFPFVRVLC